MDVKRFAARPRPPAVPGAVPVGNLANIAIGPECEVGGQLALVGAGDMITVDVLARSINLDVPVAELASRRAALKPPAPRYERGYGWMFSRHIKQANDGCDFDFLETDFGAAVPEPAIN